MTSAIYPKAKQKFMEGNIIMTTATIKVALIDTASYTYSSAHEFYSSVSGVQGTPVEITTNKAVTNGEFNGDDITFTSVTGTHIEALIIYKDTGVAGTSPLIAYIDSAASGLPVTPNGGNITVSWQNTSPYIFAL